jgi:hypothetical protein
VGPAQNVLAHKVDAAPVRARRSMPLTQIDKGLTETDVEPGAASEDTCVCRFASSRIVNLEKEF